MVWVGGLAYQAVVTLPMLAAGEEHHLEIPFLRRFLPFQWMSLWTIAVTGVALMLFDPRYRFFSFTDAWSVLLGLKQVIFLMMLLTTTGFARMLARTEEQETQGDADSSAAEPFRRRMRQFARSTLALGFIGLILAAFLGHA